MSASTSKSPKGEGREARVYVARLVATWTAVSALTLGGAMFLGAQAVLAWGRHLTAPTRGGINVGEYVEGWNAFRFVVYPGAAGLLALAGTSLCWLARLQSYARPEAIEMASKEARALKATLLLAPLALALIYAAALLVNADPEMWRPFPSRP